jgi:hypothetical protein
MGGGEEVRKRGKERDRGGNGERNRNVKELEEGGMRGEDGDGERNERGVGG